MNNEMTETWEKKPGIEAFVSCNFCGAHHETLAMDHVIAVGFGSANVTKGRELIYDEQDVRDDNYWTAQEAENAARQDPDHDWRISFYAPLYDAVYQRHGDDHWVLVEKGEGFA